MEKTMNRYLKLIAALAVSLFALPAAAQFPNVTDRILAGETASSSTSDDSDCAMVCVYNGTGAGGFLTVSAAGDMLFEEPDTATASTHIECDASIAADGSRNGTIDVSVAACDTVTEVVNIINKPESNFRCAPVAALGSDTPGPAGTGFILAVTDQSLAPPNGYCVKWDTSAQLSITAAVAPREYNLPDAYFSVAPGASAGRGNAFDGKRAYLRSAYGIATFTGAGSVQLYSVLGSFTEYTGTQTPIVAGAPRRTGLIYSETATTIWPSVASGATTVAKVFGGCDTPATGCDTAWGDFIQGRKDEKMLFRVRAATTFGTATVATNGYFYSWK